MPKIVDHEQQRQALSSTVASALAELGLENTTLRAVASRHGCTKGMVQHYFADKEELMLAALVFVEEQCEDRLRKIGEQHSGLEQLHARLNAQLPIRSDVLDEWKVRFSFATRAARSPEMRDRLLQFQAGYQKAGMTCLRKAQRAGDLKSGLSLRNSYRSLMALVSGISVSVVTGEDRLSAANQRQMLKTAIENLRH
ncbi:MAG: TetR/AcrR family transcriptional regulator [Proteobacteria bacterium]|nr:TetR/AcrR family transcriptional regulator [Pseudomonadota bacterium]